MIMWHDKNTQSPCNLCFIFEYVYLYSFLVNFLRKRHVSRGLSQHMERNDNKLYSYWQGQGIWLQEGQLPIKAGWLDVPFKFCNLAKAFKDNIWLSLSRGHNSNDSLVFFFDAYIYFWLSELPKICVLICRNLPCPQKFLATRLHLSVYFILDKIYFLLAKIKVSKLTLYKLN